MALTCEDPDAPNGIWHNWAMYDIPASRRALPEHFSRKDIPAGQNQAINDFHRQGYDGPPPPGYDPDHYRGGH